MILELTSPLEGPGHERHIPIALHSIVSVVVLPLIELISYFVYCEPEGQFVSMK